MAVSTAFAIYFVIWWIMLFAVLPWGVRSQDEVGEVAHGTDPGAPAIPRLWWKLFWTTVASALLFGAAYLVYVNRLITLS